MRLLALLVGVAGPAQAQDFDNCGFPLRDQGAFSEKEFSLRTEDGRIRGTLAAPVGGEPRALVLMLHGYTGARDENGIATLRIEFIGSGESDGQWADTTFSTQAKDAVRAATALQDAFEGDRPVSVLGYSQGGLVALRVAASEDVFDRVAVWAPALDPLATYGIIFGRETILDAAEAHRDGGADEDRRGHAAASRLFRRAGGS